MTAGIDPEAGGDATVAFIFSSNDPRATFQCAIDGQAFEECEQPYEASGLLLGDHLFRVRAVLIDPTDQTVNADPTPARWQFTVVEAPETFIDVGPEAEIVSGPARFIFSSTVAGSTFECAIDLGPFAPCESPLLISGLPDGEHLLEVRSRTPFGILDTTPEEWSWSSDTNFPQTTILSGPPAVTTSTAAAFTFSSSEPGEYECALDGGPFEGCEEGPVPLPGQPWIDHLAIELPLGQHTLRVRAVDEADLFDPTPATYTWTVVLGPQTMIDSGPQDPTSETTASIEFSSNDPDATFQCSLNDAAFTACTSPVEYSGLAVGWHKFAVRAVADGITDISPALHNWTVQAPAETTPPDTLITMAPPARTSSTTAIFRFSASELGTTFECALDAASLSPCGGRVTLTELGYGTHTFRVVATDAAGNVEVEPAVYTWVIVEGDAFAPETYITNAPLEVSTSDVASFAFAATEPATFECSLNLSAFAPCTSPREYTNLGGGDYQFYVRATDAAGNVDPSPALYEWTVEDTTPPETQLVELPADPSGSTTARFGFIGTDNTVISEGEIVRVTFECRLDSESEGAWSDCDSPQIYTGLAPVRHTFDVRAVDEAGNVDPTPASYAWTVVDQTAPETTIVDGPELTTTETSAIFEFSSNEPGTLWCQLDGALPLTACTSPYQVTGLAVGPHTFSVFATDLAGHSDATPALYEWTIEAPVDTTAPNTTIGSGPPAETASTSASIAFSSNELGSTFECSLDGAAFSVCTSPVDLTDLSVGVHQLRVRAVDAAQNRDTTPAVRNWRVTPPPETAILTGPDLETESTSASFTFESDQPGATFECALDQDVSFTPCTSGTSYDGLVVGGHEFLVRAIGVEGNVEPTPASYSWDIGDMTPPTVTIGAGGPAFVTQDRTATFTFTADDPATVFQCSLDGAPFVVCESPKTYTELDLVAQTGTVAGMHTFAVHGLVPNLLVDPVPAEYEWTIEDTTAPTTTIDSGPPAEIVVDAEPPATFVFASNEPDASFECALDPVAGEPVGWSSCADAPPANFYELNAEPGHHRLLVRAVDPSLNVDQTPAEYTWRVIGNPITTITAGPVEGSHTNTTSATFEFAADQTGVSYACSLDAAEFTPCTSPITYTAADLAGPEIDAVPYGEHSFEVQATNRFGFVEDPPASRTWTVDDGSAPQTTIDAGPSGDTLSTTATFTFGADELNVEFQCSLNGEPFSGCDSPYELADLVIGTTYTLQVFATDAAGNIDLTPASRTWTPVTPPTPNTANGTDVTVELGGATVTFAQVSVPGYTSIAAVGTAPALPTGYLSAGAAYYDITTTAEYSAPVTVCLDYDAADYSLPVRILHHDGTEWIDITLTVDPVAEVACGVADQLSPFAIAAADATVVPETTIVDGPDASTPSSTARFLFSSTDPLADFECVLDDPLLSWGSCDTPHLVEDLLPGVHDLLVRAVNTTTGNADATPSAYRWTVTAPDTDFEATPELATIDTFAFFEFSSNDPLATFECALDLESFSSCENPLLLENLLAGQHQLQARAKNDAGTFDPTPATYVWTVTPSPDTAIINRPADPSDGSSATFTFVSNVSGATFECALDEAVDAGSFSPCTSPKTYTNLIFGEHDFAVRARDAMGNVDLTPAEWSWSAEGTVPTVFISSGPDVTTESRTATFEFSAPGRDVRYECAIDGGAFSLCLSPKTYNGVPLGPHTFEVQVWIDEELEVAEPEPTTWEWTVTDGVAPETSIVWGPDNPSYATDPETGETTASFALESNDAMATFECALDGAPFTACPDPVQFSGMGPGPHILRARAVDIGLMRDASPASWVWAVILDATAPTTTINTAEVFALEGAFEAIFAFTASEPVFEFECQLDADPFEQCETPMQYSDLAPGNHVFRVRAIDLARNIEHPPVSHAFAVGLDADPPETFLGERPPATTTDDWATFTFTSDETDATFECAIEVEPDVGPAWEECFSPTQFVELEPGLQTFYVRAVDVALNADPTPEVYTWVFDPSADPPDTSILDGPPALSTSITAVFQFSATGSGIEEFECALDAEPFESCESPYIVEDLLPGEHLFLVRAVDIFGNPDPEPESYTWRVIAPPLEPTIEQTPPEPSTGNEHTFTFSSTEPNATFRCRVTPNPFQQTQFTDCTTPHTIRNLPDGEYLFEVIAVNEYGIAGEIPAEWGFEVANAPDTSIVGGPQAVTASRNAAIAFVSSEPSAEATFECSLDGDAFTECLNPFIVPDPNEFVPPDCLPGTESNAAGDACVMSVGTHIFLVQAVDIDGNVDPTPASFTWTVIEGTPPETRIDAGPGSSTTSTSATFAFSSSEGGSTFRCALDAASLATCVSPKTFTGLPLGSHQFTVVATDADGTSDETPATYSWTVGEPDTTDPETAIDLGPDALTNHTDAAFRFSAEGGATYACRLDAGAWVHCSSPIGYLDLIAGNHVFEVRATDAAGNVDDTPASYAWTIDGGRPETSITDRPANPSNGGFVSFGLAGGDDISPATDLEFDCRLDDAAWVDCADPKSYVNVDNGTHTFFVRATDKAGNTDLTPATYTWLVDNAAPETTVTGGPASTVSSTDASIAFASETDSAFECKLDDGAWGDCTSPASYTDLAGGDHAFLVRARDAAGNVDATPATRAWTVDLPPETTIDAGPSGDTAASIATFRFSSNEPGASFECALDEDSFGSCTSPLELTGLSAGPHELLVRAKDSFGSLDATPASRTWTVLPPPETTIDSVEPEMGVDALTESTSATITFSADQPGVSFACELDGLPLIPCASPVALTDLAPGAHDFEVQATGAAGSVDPTPAAFSWEIGDLTPPVVAVTQQPAASTEERTATFEFSVDDPDAVVQCSLDGAPLVLCTSPKTYSEADLALASGEVAGTHTFEVTAVKNHLLVDVVPVVVEWTITDGTAPTTAIDTDPGPEVMLDAPAVFVFSSNELDAAFECVVDADPLDPQWSECASPPENTVDFAGLEAGEHTLLVRAIDPSGNVDASPESFTWTVIGAPTTSFSSGPGQPETESTSASIAFAANQEDVTFACEFDGQPVADCASPFVRSGLAIGEHTFEVSATNTHGFVEDPAASYTWTIIEPVDSTAPETTIDAGPSGTTTQTVATIEFSANELEATFECSLDGDPFASCESPLLLTGLEVGSHAFRVQATDAAGNLDLTAAERTWTVEAVPPQNTPTGADVEVVIGQVTITFADVDAEGTTTVETLADPPVLPAGYLESGATYYGITTTASYSGPVTVCLPIDGAADPARLLHHDGAAWVDITLSADGSEVCGQAETLSPFAVATGTDEVVPNTTINSRPAAISASATATFHFSAAADGATFECSIDGGTSWSSCESPYQLTDLAIGAYEIQIRATTVAGIVETTPAVAAWTVVAPNTTIVSGPAASSRSTVADFHFSSNDLEATYECSLDGEAFGSCDSHFILEDLTVGAHELRVRAVSGAGTLDTSPAVHTWTVEGPDTTIDTGPIEPTWAVTASFTFSSNETTATLRVQARRRHLRLLRVAVPDQRPQRRDPRAVRPRAEHRRRRRPDAGQLPLDDLGAARDNPADLPGQPDR